MLEIRKEKRKWLHILGILLTLLLLGSGIYILITALSPAIPVVSGRDAREVDKKLSKFVGTFGDHLYIPTINVDVDIVSGGDSSALEKGAWHRKPENGDPVKGGNFVLSAHRFVMSYTPQGTAVKSPFYNIDKININDSIYVDYKGKRYEYKVTEKYTVKPDDVEIESRTSEPQLTLYSCTLGGSSDGRDVVVAKPVKK